MHTITKVLSVFLAGLLFFGCADILKLAKIAFEECLGPAEEGEEIFTLYKFDRDYFVPPGKLTMKTRVKPIDINENLPPAVQFGFLFKDGNTTLFEFEDDLDFDSNGRLRTITLNFLDPGVNFRKNQTLRLSFTALLVALVLSEWRYNLRYIPANRVVAILPLVPVRPSRAPMSVSVGEYEDF